MEWSVKSTLTMLILVWTSKPNLNGRPVMRTIAQCKSSADNQILDFGKINFTKLKKHWMRMNVKNFLTTRP